MSGLELDQVSKVYAGGQRAVDRVSLAVEPGTFLVLVGPSGCGKSSLLRMIAGLESISGGEVRIGGRVVNELPPRERDVAMVFQNYALYPHMSVFENMAFGLELRKRPRAEIDRTVRATADMLGLVDKLASKPRELSGGERQRVALGRAMVREPRVFLFDEPLSNLDAKLRVTMRGEIHRLHQRLSSTMVYVTHDQVEALTLGERIAVMRAGVLQQLADPDTLYQRPANAFVAGFIGSPPMNLLAAEVGADGAIRIGGTAAEPALEAGPIRPEPAPEFLGSARPASVLFGVRPEDLTLRPTGAGAKLPAVLEVRESLGNETLLYWRTAAGPVVSRVHDEPTPEIGTRNDLHFRFERIRWFDATTGNSLP